jgi:hypothetical protein
MFQSLIFHSAETSALYAHGNAFMLLNMDSLSNRRRMQWLEHAIRMAQTSVVMKIFHSRKIGRPRLR